MTRSQLRRAGRGLLRWLGDYRTGLTFLASVVVALVLVVVITSARTTQEALAARQSTATSATRRIDLLNERIVALSGQAESNGRLLGEALAKIQALQEQVRQLGGRPVITVSPSTSTTAPRATTATTPSAGTTTTTSTTTTMARRCVIGAVCLP